MRKKLLTVNDVIKILQKVENKDTLIEVITTEGYVDNIINIFAGNYIEDEDGYIVPIKEIK